MKKPKITFNRIGQIVFTFKEVTKLISHASPRLLILTFILNALWGFLSVPGFYLDKLVLDKLVQAIGNTNWQSLIYGLAFLFGLRILLDLFRNFLGNITNLLRSSLSRVFNAELELIKAEKFNELDIATLEDSEFQNKFQKIDRESGRRTWALIMPLADIPNYLIGFISAVVVLIFLHPLIAIVMILISIPGFLVNSRFVKKEYELSTSLSPIYRLWGWISYYLFRNQNIMELKILNLSDYLITKLKVIQKEIIKKERELDKKREISKFGTFILINIFELFLSIWLAILVITQKITIGSFQLYLSSARSAQSNLSGLVSSFTDIYENYVFVVDLIWFLHLKPTITKNEGKLFVKNAPEIEFKNISFSYKDKQKLILKDMNFKIKSGERIAIVGENGAGKSTLIKLIARFYDPKTGEVLINDQNLKNYNLENWHDNLAILFQNFQDYPFTVRESIGYGDVKNLDSFEEIKMAAKKTDIDEFIQALPLKYENPLEPSFEKGVRPSAGQSQRLGISRMLFRKNANILIMDEPTSNVDPEAEEKIFKELTKKTKGKILIFVTQRFSTVRLADRIFVLDKGKIVEQGTHNELMSLGGKYAKLFNLQAKGYQ